MLQDKDRIFTNLYGFHSWKLDAARGRGAWDGTKELLGQGPDWVVDQIKDRTVRELRPKDLFYQILHGLRSLTRYDHSSSILIAEDEGARLVLHAEQVAWVKGKSRRIGRRIRVPEALRATLRMTSAVSIVSPGAGRSGRDGEDGKGTGKGRMRLARLST